MSDIAANIAAWTITIALVIYGSSILWLHTWMRTLEHGEGEDEDE